jgi:prepilin-type processing-associated H-X9-DG protein/prepilin-type N-terminal cleavage/methylation domain-containing protein
MLNRYNGGDAGRANRFAGSRRTRALTLVEVLVVLAVIAIVAVILLPAIINHGDRAMPKAAEPQCESQLKQIGIAFRTWEGDYGNKYPMSVPTNKGGSMEFGAGNEMFMSFQVMSNELANPQLLICPTDGRDLIQDFTKLSNSNISYFVGLDADETRPAMFLGGDRNLVTNGLDTVPGLVVLGTNTQMGWSSKMHNGLGNILFADGSVRRISSADLQTFLSNTGTNVTRLAVP